MTYRAESADKWSELATKFRADGAGGSQLGALSSRNNEFQDVAPWHLDDATSDIRAQFKLRAAEAARALGASLKETSSLNLWLHHVYQFLVYEHSPRPRPCLVVSSADRDGTTVHVESPTIDNVFAASAAFCLSLLQQALEGELPPKAQRFQAWIVENSSAPKLPNSHCSMQGWISAVAKCATTPFPIDFLSARLNVLRLPHQPAEFDSLRAFFDQVAREEGLMWAITERGLWMAQQQPSARHIDAYKRQHEAAKELAKPRKNEAKVRFDEFIGPRWKTLRQQLGRKKAWAVAHPGCNWGVATGENSGVAVIDVDGEQGRAAQAALEKEGFFFPATLTVQTGREDGGAHLYYRLAPGADVRNNNSGKLAPHIDIRGTGGYVVVPPSVHVTRRQYRFVDPTFPLATLPDWVINRLRRPAARPAAAPGAATDKVSKGKGTNLLVSLAGTMHKRGMSPAAIEQALLAENAAKCDPPLPEEKVRAIAHDIPKRYPNEPAPFPDQMRAAVDDPRPRVRLPGDNWLLSETAAALGQHFADELLFLRIGEIVTLEGNELRTVSAQTFRTLVECYVVCYRKRKAGDNTFSVGVTMTENEACGIMASPQFIEGLRRVRRLNLCRQPVLRSDGAIELLPEGYDAATQTLTISTVSYTDDMPLADAVETIDDLFSEFEFGAADRGRSKAVTVAALVGLFSAQLLPEGSLRPAFDVTKNAEGAGATTLVTCAVVPILGWVSFSALPKEEPEMRKFLTTAVMDGRSVIIFDNVKGLVSSPELESFLSEPQRTDRILGLNKSFTGPNLATVFITANGATFSPDMRRRSLVIELHLEAEHAEDRHFRRPLDLATLAALRPKILAACWSLVRNWQAQGQPLPARSHSAFPAWARVVGGIVEAAGYGCALDTAAVAVAADEDGDAMRTLVAVMTPGKNYTFSDIVALCRSNECFRGLVGDEGADMGNAAARRCRASLADTTTAWSRTGGSSSRARATSGATGVKWSSRSTMTRSSTMFQLRGQIIMHTRMDWNIVLHRVIVLSPLKSHLRFHKMGRLPLCLTVRGK